MVVQIDMNKSQNRNRNRDRKQTTKTIETQTECETEWESGNNADIEFITKTTLHPCERPKWQGKVAKFKYLWFIFSDGKASIFNNL